MDKNIRQAENEVRKLEQEIEKLEGEIDAIDEQMHDPLKFKELSKEPGFYDKYEAKKQKLEKLMADWEKWQKKLEKAMQGKEAIEN